TVSGTLVAYNADLEAAIDSLGKSDAQVIIRQLRDDEDLKQLIKVNLAARKIVIIEPSKRMFAEYFTVQGFCDAMTAIGEELSEAKVFIPAGCYGSRHLFALRLRDRPSGE